MDKNIYEILNKIEKCGFEAYIVGGYVRDYLLGIKSYDIDICTNALPKDIAKIFIGNVSNINYGLKESIQLNVIYFPYLFDSIF